VDKTIFYVSLFLIIVGIGGQLAWYFYGVIPNTQASFQEMQNVSGYMMILGFIMLPAGLFKDGPPAPSNAEKTVMGVFLVLLVGIGFTSLLVVPSASSGPACKPQVTIMIPLGAQSGSLPANGNYLPNNVTVIVGVNNTVQWTNNDTALHSVSDPAGNPLAPHANAIQPGQAVCVTLAAGTYNYHCIYHSWMTGTITVLANKTASS
jgi:plastocyanin